MTVLIVLGALWVLAGAVVALLPMRLQYLPGGLLMLAAPALIVAFAIEAGWIAGLAALVAFVSMYRNPLRHYWNRARGRKPELPQ